jgi:UPF0271 protein
MARIDLNADLGESYGRWRMPHDRDLLDLVTSANVACGFHAGDPPAMLETVRQAAQRGVSIGAHPGYPDLMGFGRRDLDASPAEVTAYVIYQIGALQACCAAAGTKLRYVKPHGALYNRAVRHMPTAQAINQAILAVDPGLVLLCLAGTEWLAEARGAGLAVAAEAFIDRNYEPDGTLTPRSEPDAVLHDPESCGERAVRLVTDGVLTARDGSTLVLRPDSLCAHGDGPTAVALLDTVRRRLTAAGVTIEAFAT